MTLDGKEMQCNGGDAWWDEGIAPRDTRAGRTNFNLLVVSKSAMVSEKEIYMCIEVLYEQWAQYQPRTGPGAEYIVGISSQFRSEPQDS